MSLNGKKEVTPHAHILGICNADSKPHTPEDFNTIVCAEIPDKQQFPELHLIITMIGPNSGIAPI